MTQNQQNLKLHFSSLSSGASVDQQTGTLSIFEMIEEIRVPQVPVSVGSLVIALAFEKQIAGATQGKLFIHVIGPDQNQVLVGQGDLGVPADQKRVRAVFRFSSFPLQTFGRYRFVISWTNEAMVKEGEALLDFDVSQSTQVAQGVAPPKTGGNKPPLAH